MMRDKREIKIVIVEDDFYYNKLLLKYVETICNESRYPGLSFRVASYLTADRCLKDLKGDADIMILDYYLKNSDGSETLNGEDILKAAHKLNPKTKVVMISAQQNMLKAVELMREGIYEYVDKNAHSGAKIGKILNEILTNEIRNQN